MPKLTAAVAAARRAHILRSAFRCFARRGFTKTSMTDLYREAGVSAGSVYTWFRSKEEIIEATYRENTIWVTDLIAELTQQKEGPAALAEVVRTAAGLFDRPEWLEESRVNVQVWGEALTNERLQGTFLPAFDTYRRLLAEAVGRAQAGGVVTPAVEPLAVAQVVWGLVLGLEAQKAWDPQLDAQAYAQAAAALLTGSFVQALTARERRSAMSEAEKNKRIVQEFIAEVFNDHKLGEARKYFAETYKHHSPLPGLPPGFAGFEIAHRQLTDAFPDLHLEVEELVAEGDVVAGRTRLRGTQRGPFMGQPANGKAVNLEVMEYWYLRDGQFTEHRALIDRAALMEQIGTQ